MSGERRRVRLFEGYSYEFGKALNELVSGRYARRDVGGAMDRMLAATEHMFDPWVFLYREVEVCSASHEGQKKCLTPTER